MIYQFWWSEKIGDAFTDIQRDYYRSLMMNQVFPIGNPVDGRRLFRACTSKDNFDKAIEFLSAENLVIDGVTVVPPITDRDPIICDARCMNGVRYGYEEVITGYDEEGNPIKEIQAVSGQTPYDMNDAEYEKYVTDGGNTAAGWASWGERK